MAARYLGGRPVLPGRMKLKPRRTPTKEKMVVGVEEVQALFKALPEEAQRTAVKTALQESAEVLLAAMQRTVPRKTGVLAGSLQIFPVRKARTRSSIRVGAGKEGFYGAFLEYGFHARDRTWVPAQPWIRPALDSAFGQTVNTFRVEFGEGVERASVTLAEQHFGGV